MCTLPTKWGGIWVALPNLLPNVWLSRLLPKVAPLPVRAALGGQRRRSTSHHRSLFPFLFCFVFGSVSHLVSFAFISVCLYLPCCLPRFVRDYSFIVMCSVRLCCSLFSRILKSVIVGTLFVPPCVCAGSLLSKYASQTSLLSCAWLHLPPKRNIITWLSYLT